MSIANHFVTLEQLAEYPYTERSCELVDGVVVDVSPASWRHGAIAGRILQREINSSDQQNLMDESIRELAKAR